jgi:fatty acid desaturase
MTAVQRRHIGQSEPFGYRRPQGSQTAGKVTMVAVFAGVTVAVAARGGWWWPFAVILAVGGFSYLLGLSNYGVGEEGSADDADDRHQVRSPVSH